MRPICTHPKWGELTKQTSCVHTVTQEGSLSDSIGISSDFASMSASATLVFWRASIMGDTQENNSSLEWHMEKT